MYDGAADPPGHYTWHADEEALPERLSKAALGDSRIVSVSVQLTDPAEYEEGTFQVHDGPMFHSDASCVCPCVSC